MTEVDAEFKAKPMGGKESQNTDNVISTKYSEVEGNTSVPKNRSSMLAIEKEEFKQVIKEIINKEQPDKVQLEERIMEKIRKRNLSKGWDRPSGKRVAPLKLLQSLK